VEKRSRLRPSTGGSTGPHRVCLDQWIDCAPFERLLNMEIIEAVDGHSLLTMPFYLDYAQGAGLMHGGALVSLADTAVGMAIKSVLPPQTHFATIELSTKFLAPVKTGIVTARARIKKMDGRTIFGEATVYAENGRAVLEFESIFKVAKDAKIRDL
jgi:acyl-CoA thioesterase